MEKRVKRIVSTIIIVAMVLTNGGFSVLASSADSVYDRELETIATENLSTKYVNTETEWFASTTSISEIDEINAEIIDEEIVEEPEYDEVSTDSEVDLSDMEENVEETEDDEISTYSEMDLDDVEENIDEVETNEISTDSELDLHEIEETDNIATASDIKLFESNTNNALNVATESSVLNEVVATFSYMDSTLFGTAPTPIADSEKFVFNSDWWQEACWDWSNHNKSQVRKINFSPMVFGNYYQSSEGTSAGKTPIEWKILDKSHEDKTLLLSEKILFAQDFGLNASDKYPGWAGSHIRTILNNEDNGFIAHAFTEKERELILTTTVHTNGQKNQYGNIFSGGPDCDDKIFILSAEEAKGYFGYGDDNNSKRIAVNTGFVNADYWRHDLPGEGEAFRYWLRNPAYYVDNQQAKTVEYDGKVDERFGDTCTYANGVRPMLWVNFNYKALDPITDDIRFEKRITNSDGKEIVHYYMMNDGTLEIKLALGY